MAYPSATTIALSIGVAATLQVPSVSGDNIEPEPAFSPQAGTDHEDGRNEARTYKPE